MNGDVVTLIFFPFVSLRKHRKRMTEKGGGKKHDLLRKENVTDFFC